jgi:DNA (cytosine-5)-methyltransferase 1
MPRPIGIDLFAGAGGLSLGFEQAGFNVVAAVEIDPIHCAVHKFNFPNCTVFPQSISNLTGAEIRAKTGLGRRRIDVVFGGAPCQGFSMMGQRALDDPRNCLVRDFVRVVAELNPAYFVFENVKGLTLGEHRLFLEELIEAFSAANYRVRLPWKVFDVSEYGVPQHRERLILMGARRGQPLPDYPPAMFRSADSPKFGNLPIGPTCKGALGDLPDVESYDELFESDAVRTNAFGVPSDYARAMRCLRNAGWYYGYRREWNPNQLTSSLRTVHTPISQRRFAETQPGEVEPISRFYKLSPKGLSNTLRAGTDSARGAFTSPRPIHYEYPRCVTVREMARLHGFPDWFRFHATKWHGARQIGNSVPPPFARAIAGQILKALGVEPERPSEPVALGDPMLLQWDMSAASEYFGVPIPIRKRDRKSGARKRTQHEIEAVRCTSQLEMSFA